MATENIDVHHRSPTGAKIALFRSLFRGREDVYPRRFESRKSGKSGYQPACANEWVVGICQKPKVKCADCPQRDFFPITDDVIRWHLSGQDDAGRDFVMGAFPMLCDETCFFLAANPDVRVQFQDLYGELIADEHRNQTICDEVVQAVREGRSPLVLTERNEHIDRLAAQLAPSVAHLVVLRGGTRPKDIQAVMASLAAIPENEQRVLLATGRYIGEGFDDARLDTLFLTLPV